MQNVEAEIYRMMEIAKTTKRISKRDVITIHDVDLYRYQKGLRKDGTYKPNATIKSRYATLVDLFGEKYANTIMRNLEVQRWNLKKLS